MTLSLNEWALGGSWNVDAERGVLQVAPGKIVFRFHPRDVHMVLGPTKNREPLRFKVKLDGVVPGDNSGVDSAPDGGGGVREPCLYLLIRQKGRIGDRTLRSNSSIPAYRRFPSRLGKSVGDGCRVVST